MRNIHPAVWTGLVLNGLLILALHTALTSLSPSELPEVDPTLFEALRYIFPLMLALLAGQALAVGLIASRIRAGIVVAAVSSFLMLPAALIYLVGCLLSHYRILYSPFTVRAEYSRVRHTFPSMAASRLPYFAGAGMVASALCFSAHQIDLGITLLGLSLTAAYLALRTKKYPALSIHDRYFVLTPGLFAGPLLIPYARVRKATLYDDESIRFEIETASGAAVLPWSLLRVENPKRRVALESLGNALSENGVPLY